MAMLQKVRLLPNERLDLSDFNNIENFVCADFKAINKNVWAGDNYVFSGFLVTGTGTNTLSVGLAGSEAIIGKDDGVLYIGAPSLSNLITNTLTPSATNYVEITINQNTGGADSRALWDTTAAGGQGAEFSQIVDTYTFLEAKFVINTSNFTGSPQNMKLCEVDVNGSGTITQIRDRRNMFWRLGRAGNDTYSYVWASRTEPPVTQFTGADKDIASFKDMLDAIMTTFKELKASTHWFDNVGVSLPALMRNAALSHVVPRTTSAMIKWDGANLQITDNNPSPASGDVIAAVRLFDSTSNLFLARQDGQASTAVIPMSDGDVLWVQVPSPLAATTYTGLGVIASNYRVSVRGSVPNLDTTFWLAYREGSNLYWRDLGLVLPGSQGEIGDPESTALTDNQEDRSGYFRADQPITWTGTQVIFTTDIILEMINTKLGVPTLHRILTAQSPITLLNGESIWISINRQSASETVTANRSSITPIPAQLDLNKDVFVLARRVDVTGLGYLHIPYHKQVINPGQTVRLGASGSGTGSGGGNSILETLKNQLVDSPFELVTPNIFSSDADTKVDVSSTGAYSLLDSTFKFSGAGQTMVSTQSLDGPEFFPDASDVTSIDLSVFWTQGSVDANAVYQVSRNGGGEYQTVSMSRVGNSTEAFRGVLVFQEESTPQIVSTYALSNADTQVSLNASTQQQLDQPFTLATSQVAKSLILYTNKVGSPAGTLLVSLIRDSAGSPSTNPLDVMTQSAPVNVSSLPSGNGSVTVVIPKVVLPAGTYHLVVSTDAAYKTSYSVGVTDVRLRADGSSPSAAIAHKYNGSAWSTITGTAFVYELDGRIMDLRVKITSSAGSKALDGYGIFYDLTSSGLSRSAVKNREVRNFDGVSDNLSQFTLTSFIPDADLLTVYEVETGQAYAYGAFSLNGYQVTFPTNTFQKPGRVTLVFSQNGANSFDNSDLNSALMAANHLGSTDGAIDKSIAGRGLFLRRPDGTLREITIDNADNLQVWSI